MMLVMGTFKLCVFIVSEAIVGVRHARDGEWQFNFQVNEQFIVVLQYVPFILFLHSVYPILTP